MKDFVIGIEYFIAGMTTCYSVVTTKVNKLLNIVSADVVATAEDNSIDCDFCLELKAFHSVEGCDNITAHCKSTVIFKKHYVVLLKVRLNCIRHLRG